MMKKENTPVLKFIKIAWENAASNPHSWERFNSDISTVCHIAAAGFPWEKGDINKILEIGNWKSGVWRCLGEPGLESLYSTAVKNGNATAWIELERYFNRLPIIVDNVDGRKRSRIRIGSIFYWKGEQVKVTSFNKDGHAICCSYKDNSGYREKINHRYTISEKNVKTERRKYYNAKRIE